MAAALDSWDYCVMLADRDARIVATRWGCARMRRMFELLGEALHGTIFREETTGTNSIATTYELRHAVAVHGDEHFIAQLHGLSCYGHPIIDPHTRRLEGVLSITCLAGERNPLVAPYVASAAAEIEQRLLEGRSPNERALLAALQRELRAGRDRPTLAIGSDILLANATAIELLDAPDHALIRDIAASCTGEATKAAHVTLSNSRGADITCRTLTASAGAVLTITNVKSLIPQVLSQSLADATRGVLICGEPGAGHTTAIQMAAASRSLRDPPRRTLPRAVRGRVVERRAAERLGERHCGGRVGASAVSARVPVTGRNSQQLRGDCDPADDRASDELILQTRQLISRCTD